MTEVFDVLSFLLFMGIWISISSWWIARNARAKHLMEIVDSVLGMWRWFVWFARGGAALFYVVALLQYCTGNTEWWDALLAGVIGSPLLSGIFYSIFQTIGRNALHASLRDAYQTGYTVADSEEFQRLETCFQKFRWLHRFHCWRQGLNLDEVLLALKPAEACPSGLAGSPSENMLLD